jgi:IMP dehydrogenase/GMP reductase
MFLDNDIKLDFSDVLILPKRSKLESRADVSLERTIKFPYAKHEFIGIPIIASNMIGVGTFNIHNALAQFKILTAISKHYTISDWVRNEIDPDYAIMCIGITDSDIKKAKELIDFYNLKYLMIDVANGYSEKFIDFIKKVRDGMPDICIMAGNVVTKEMTEALILSGVDVVKIGVGNGCLAGDSKVLLSNGTYKNIKDIKIHDKVINMHGNPVEVIGVQFSGFKKVKKYRNNLFYLDTLVTNDHLHWVGDYSSTPNIFLDGNCEVILERPLKNGGSKFKWSDLSDNLNFKVLCVPRKINFEMPKTIEIDMTQFKLSNRGFDGQCEIPDTITQSYELGYLIGTFLGDGFSRCTKFKCKRGDKITNNTCGSLFWYFGKNEVEYAQKVTDYLKLVFGANGKILHEENMTKVKCQSNIISRFFLQFYCGEKKKTLPDKYLIDDADYMKGIYDGMLDSDGHYAKDSRVGFSNTSSDLIEKFMIIFHQVNGYFPSVAVPPPCGFAGEQLLENHNFSQLYTCRSVSTKQNDTYYQMNRVFSDITEEEIEIATYDIQVDCETSSFIVNNSVVHNSVCKTRVQTGVGFPQLSSVIETSNYAHALNANIISDGGCTCIGDISKAFCAGADFVQLGTMLAGHREGDQEIINKYKKKEYIDSEDDSVYELHQFVEFFGSSSKKAQENYFGGFNDYRASEGREVLIPYKGPIENTIKEILGGIRSTCTYIGAKQLKNLPKCATFIRVNNQLSKVMEKYERSI